MPEHGIELVQLFYASEQSGKDFLEITGALRAVLAIFLYQSLLLLGIGAGQARNIDHELLALGQELVQWRIEQADRYWQTIHGFQQADEIGALHGQQFLQRDAP